MEGKRVECRRNCGYRGSNETETGQTDERYGRWKELERRRAFETGRMKKGLIREGKRRVLQRALPSPHLFSI